MQRSRAKARTEETAENSTRATIRRTRQTDDNGANGPSQAGDSGGPAAHGSDQDFDQRILGMEKAVGTAFYRNNLGEYGWVNRSTSQSSSRCGRQAERPADASSVDQYVIFNIRRNRYRLVTIIHYSRQKGGRITEGHVYIRSLLTHKQYDDRKNWDKGVKK